MTSLIFCRTVITKERVLTPESNEDDGLGEIETPKPMSQSEIRYGHSCVLFYFSILKLSLEVVFPVKVLKDVTS